ncbi:uncharacterized protein [Linepithema humile]|uniref:uncharacterized protein isoform X1 n=1 Tax=Linepithema humile TaxID=83485 RepID=UPI00351EB99F
MNDEKHNLYKPGSSERRLRLRKDYKESTDDTVCLSVDSNNENGKNDVASTSKCDDDSIMDFKSPIKKHFIQPKVINSSRFPDRSKTKVLCSKTKVTNNEKRSGSSKSLQSSKILRNKQQPSIESSFFKSEKKEADSPQSLTDVKTAYVCPLCFKNFKDENSQAVHAKSCAAKNNVTTKKLMDAMELQERQAAERKSLGLLSAPVLQDKKKPAPRKMASHNDPDLQLALALSKSLYEKEMEEWDEVQIIAMSSSSPLPDNNLENAYKTTLQNFGFTSNRNVEPARSTNKTKRRKLLEPTTLQNRTAVERERILTERIAEILMGYKDFTQNPQEVEKQLNIKEKIVIKNQLLQQLHRAENTLWDRTKLTSTQNVFYVKQLLPQITPLEKKEQKLKEEQIDVKLEDQSINNEISLDNKQMQEIQAADNNEKLIISSNSSKTCCKEKKFLDILATSWKNILNDSSASDIIIFVRNSRHIWAHKLVFYVRCTDILLDVTSNDTEYSTAKEKICWTDVDYDAALAFLEFIYCGLIDRHLEILNSDTLSGVRFLARKYKVNDLFVYLRQLELNSTTAQVKYTTCEKSTENLHANVRKGSNVSKLEKSTFNVSSNHICNDLENIQCSQKMQKVVNDTSHSLEDSCISAKDSCVLQDEKIDLMKLSEKINPRSDTPTNCTSPDLFDDTPVTKRNAIIKNSESAMHSEDHEDSNIHVLLSLIKQDADTDICSQRSLTQRAEYSESCKEMSTCLENVEQSVIEIDSDSEVNSLKSFIEDAHENSLIDTPQSSKPKFSQDCSLIKQKSDLTLFIEKIQQENAKSDLDSDTEYPVEMSFTMHKNPFRVDRHADLKNSQSCDDNDKISDRKQKHGKLSIIEQRMQSYAEKNPEFYSHLSNECVETVKRITSHVASTSPEKTMKSFQSNVSNYTQNCISPADKDISKQVTITPSSSQIKTTNQSPSETVFDYETDEEDISMYSKYMRNHKDNSIAKYRTAIRRNKSDGNLSNKNVSSHSITKNSDINESKNNEVVAQSTLTQKDVDVIVSSDTEIESVSSNVSCPVALQKDDSDREDNIFQTGSDRESSKQNIENERNKSLEFEIPKAITTDLEEEINVNDTTKSNRDEFNTSNAKMTSDDMDFSAVLTQKSKLNESNDDQNAEFIPSPIMISSSPDFLKMESLLPEHKNTETDSRKSRNTAEFSLNFEDDIYLANVNVDRYEKHHLLEKSQSASQLSITKFRKNSSRRYSNKNNRENIKHTNTMSDDVTPENLDRMALTQNSTSIRTFKKKSLSEGQININRLRNQQSTSEHISMRLQCKYNENIGSSKTAPKIIEKDVTPPPDYHGMKTPELHKEMKKYGLKAQKRSRAVKLLTHIYNELHPLVSISEATIEQKKAAEILSDENEGPPPKKRNMDNNSLEKSNDSDDELLCSQDSNDSMNSVKDATSKEMQFYETESLPALENSSDIAEAFTKLIVADKHLHNKILRYEPVNIETLHSTLRTHGFKCKLSNLMSFLDEQCITFYAPEQNAKSRTRKKV